MGHEAKMRFAAAACAVAILVCVAVFGAVLAQRVTAPVVAPAPAAVRAPAAKPAPAPTVQTVAAAVSDPAPAVAPAATPAAAPVAPPPAAAPVNCPGHPDALGISRVVEIDTTGGPGFGFEHLKPYDVLQPRQGVLTFGHGPLPPNTQAVLAAPAAHFTKAVLLPSRPPT